MSTVHRYIKHWKKQLPTTLIEQTANEPTNIQTNKPIQAPGLFFARFELILICVEAWT
ncbi:hypothetical protein [Lentibacillus salinarum]|uniref:Transposase n=1 Tax=Lentibacillus salinarum TaxID=446820 RepID=A0ABW3ZU56_9BACI